MSQVIILNGVGSVGKSSTARELQAIAMQPFLHVAMDAFIEMTPAKLIGHADGLVFKIGEEAGHPSVAVETGPVLERALRGMRHAVAALADQGNDLIVDEVMLGDEHVEYRALLQHHDLRFVGLFAPLEVLEARERARGDRVIGLSRWQYTRMHNGLTYDLEIDTTATTPFENARRICLAFDIEAAA